MSGHLLEIRDLSVRLPVDGVHAPVVDGLNLHIGAGEAVALVGESGSGKSMTARSVLQLLPAAARSSGAILFDGDDILEMNARRLRKHRTSDVALIGQDPRNAVNPVRRIEDFLTESMRIVHRMDAREARERSTELLLRVGIAQPAVVMRRYPHELSGGMLQRVVIAAALAARPRLLIADEPTTALDVTTQAEVMATIAELRADQGMALLFISHDLDLAAAVCDRTAVMYAGRVVEEQASVRLHEAPRHPYTVALLGARPHFDQPPGTTLTTVRGRSQSAFEAPAGCPFSSRCDYANDKCRHIVPEPFHDDAGLVACLRHAELSPQLGASVRTPTPEFPHV